MIQLWVYDKIDRKAQESHALALNLKGETVKIHYHCHDVSCEKKIHTTYKGLKDV